MSNNHLLIKKYLEDHSLVESNIVSFNNFIEKRIQEVVDEINESIETDDFEINLGKVEIKRPNVIEADGSYSEVTPSDAKLRNFTYSSPINLEITVKKDGQVDSEKVEIGRIPVMVKSNLCNSYGMTSDELIKNNMDPLNPGGYFLIKGNERVMILAEDLAENQAFIERDAKNDLKLKLFSLKGTYRIPTVISENKEGLFEISFSRFNEVPIIVLLKALGMTKESDIAKYLEKQTDNVIVNLYEFVDIANREDALMYIAEKIRLQGTKREILQRVNQRIDSYLFPHIGQKKEDRMKKAITLCKLTKQFLNAKKDPSLITDKDHYANKRVRLSGDLLASLFRVNLNILVRDIKYSLQKSSKRKKFFSIKVIAKSTLFSKRIESAIATGSWVGGRKGITQNMQKTNYLDTISQLQRVSSMLASEQENFLARTLHPTHYGRFCPIESPEGTEIGLRKNISILAKVSTRIKMDEKKFIDELFKLGLSKDPIEGNDVFLNGMFIGNVTNADAFVNSIKNKRREGDFPIQMNIRNNEHMQTVLISTEPGRVLRPLIISDNGVPRLNKEHLIKLNSGDMKWSDLIEQG
ncbi:MAG: DNA-directed RNA polymerase subunit B'', partial [Nanoarchaeota archaeon]